MPEGPPYSSSFELAFSKVMESEGGFVDHPNDPGGATKYGVSLRFLRGLHKDRPDIWFRIFGTELPSVGMVRNLSIDKAKAVGYQCFWLPAGCSAISGLDIPYALFDMAFNMGVRQAVKILQRAMNDAMPSKYKRLKVDGRFGSRTLAALHGTLVGCGDNAVLTAIRLRRQDFYESLVRKNNRFRPFLKGWLRRAVEATQDTADLPDEKEIK